MLGRTRRRTPAPACTLRGILLDIAYKVTPIECDAEGDVYRDRRWGLDTPLRGYSTDDEEEHQCSRPCRPCSTDPSSPSRCSPLRPTFRRARSTPRSCGRTRPTSPTRRRSSMPATCCSPPAPSSRHPTIEAEFADEYVRRLRDTGVAALGFGTEVIRAGTPDALVDACARQGLPLFEVPYRVPFIAIARLVADLLAEDAYARQAWALAAQRAISLAALRPDGLSATLAELVESPRRMGRAHRRVGVARPRGARRRPRPARPGRGRRRGAVDAPARPAREPHGRRRRGRRRAAAHHHADPRRRRRPARGARDRRLRASSTQPAARSSPRSSPSRAWRSSRTATSTGRAGTCARGCCAASSRATPSWPSGSPPRCGGRCPPRRSGSR